jgi:ComF family protein
MSLIHDFISLIYPRICSSCGITLMRHEQVICSYCIYHLPKTNFHLMDDNPVYTLFWGRVNLSGAASFFYFNKGGKVQHMIHLLKYKGKREVGIRLGELYGAELQKSSVYKELDVVVPVPLHPRKKRKRGYNQSEMIARGIAAAMNIEMNTTCLIRESFTQTQTRKARYKRWENVKDVFKIVHPEKLEGKKILLVDDVITTGATLEACASWLSELPGAKVYVASLACAVK